MPQKYAFCNFQRNFQLGYVIITLEYSEGSHFPLKQILSNIIYKEKGKVRIKEINSLSNISHSLFGIWIIQEGKKVARKNCIILHVYFSSTFTTFILNQQGKVKGDKRRKVKRVKKIQVLIWCMEVDKIRILVKKKNNIVRKNKQSIYYYFNLGTNWVR